MNEADGRRVRDSLTTYATRAVPGDVDLWPTIVARIAARPPRSKRLFLADALGRLVARPRPMFARLGVALLVVALLLTVAPPWLSRDQSSASAAELLHSLAAVAAAQPAPSTVGANGYRYIKFDSTYLSTIASTSPSETPIAALVSKTREMWVAPDGSGRIRETAGEPVFLSAPARAAWESAGKPDLVQEINQDFGPGGLWYEDFASYPTDVTALTDVIRQRAGQEGPPVDVEMFIVVGDLLRQPGAPTDLRAALYQVAANIPDVELIGEVTDRAGRQGVAVAKSTTYWGGVMRYVLIFDPKTAALLGEEQVVIEPVPGIAIDGKLPVVIGQATYLDSGVVSALPDRPLAADGYPGKPRPVESTSSTTP